MKQIPSPIRLGLTGLLMILATGCFRYASERVNSEPQAARVEAGAAQLPQPAETSHGIIVHIDPRTGEIIAPPARAPVEVPEPPADIAKKPPAELREVPSPVPGGGVMIELDERFRTPLTATIDADGKVKLEHKGAASDSDGKK